MASSFSSVQRRWLRAIAALVLVATCLAGAAQPAQAVSTTVVISQVYGGGGNTGATHTHDYVELFNRGTAPASLSGWSIQYASATGSGNFGANSGQLTELQSVTLAPGQYYLIQEASNAAVGAPLPTPDVTDATPISMAAGAGKVALVNTTASLGCNGGSTPCNAGQLAQIVDLVGYGTGTSGANFFEGTGPAPTISATTADSRNSGGCNDTDNNNADFTAGAPSPRNTASPLNPCGTPNLTINDISANEGNSGTTTFTFTLSLSAPAGAGGVTFDIATQDNTATLANNDYVDKALTGQTIPAGSSSYTFSVLVSGDTTTEPDETFFVNVSNVTGATVVDGQGQGTIVDDDTDFCALPYTPIYQIQGSGPSAAITGNVTTQGVVVGDFEGSSGLQGFYLQDASGDGDSATSDGIFVFTGNANFVSAGQVVRVTGYARERFNQTTLNGSNSNTSPVTNIVNCGSTGSVTPTDVTMPFPSADYPERFEGMLVRFPQPLVISEYFNYDRFGEIVLALPLDGESRPFTGTAIDEPGAPAQARTLANSLRRITLDDGRGEQNPEFLRHPNGSAFALNNRFRGGDTVQNTVGVLGFDFSLYRIQPTGPADYTAVNPRPAAPERVDGSLRVAAMNTLNFFLTLDAIDDDSGPDNPADNVCGGNANLECRGADASQPDEFSRQRNKLLAALAGLNGDIIGLNELENTTGVDPLGDPTKGIVAGLNAMPGVGTYSYIDTGVIGTDAIRVGLIYKPSKVTPVGAFKILTTAVDPRFIDTKNRPSLAQTFEVAATGARFTVVVNHLKSKGSDCNDVGDPDTGDGQGNCKVTRTQAAKALVDWLATDPTGSGDPDFLIMGDLNSYAQEDPIDAIKAGADDTAGTGDDYTNLIAQYQGTYAYSYVFDGQAGYLDHALANSSLAPQVTRAADWHINSDEPDVVDYDTSFKGTTQEALYEPNAYRSSDHDPVVVGLNLNAPPTVDAGGPYSVNEGGSAAVTATGNDPNTGDTLTYAWDLDSNGSFETSGQSTTFSAAGLDGPSSYTIKVRVTDSGGLSAVDEATVNVQNVVPSVNTPVVAPEPSIKGSAVIASASFSDPAPNDAPFACTVDYGDGSGALAGTVSGNTCTGSSHTYASVGSFTVIVSVTDKDNGTGSNSTTHAVIYNFTGFFQPVDNLPTFNVVKAGSGVPVRFSLSGDQGLNIFAAGNPKSEMIACNSADSVDGIEETVTAGSSSLTYDSVTDTYTYVWKTNKAWANTCRQLVIQLNDGTFQRANFMFPK